MAPQMAPGATVVVDGIAKEFRTERMTTVALSSLSLQVSPGELVCVVGPSGCGKSTLLRILGGLEFPSTGRVLVDGLEVRGPSTKNGFVFQRPALFPWLDVLDNVTFGPRMQGRGSTAQLREEAHRYLRAVGLDGFERARIYHLSGGMLHRVALARVLINRPKVLLMDEPFGALDAQTRLVMQELLVKIWQTDRSTLVFVTHDVDEALVLSDRVLVMTARPGRIKAEYRVPLARPRDLAVVTSPEFSSLKREILASIREELSSTELSGLLA